MFLKKLSALCLTAALMSSLSASALAVEYPDVAPEYWAYADIQKASDFGLVQGMDDGSFQPTEKLNRASFVTILQRMFSWQAETPETPSFTDCAPSDWFYGAVEAARAHGVLEESAAFQPKAYITREEMAVMLVRALGYEALAQDLAAEGYAPPFTDVTTHPGHIAVAYAIGMTNGIRDEKTGLILFEPASFATREQAAAMLARVYERYRSKLDYLHGFYAFASYSQIAYTDRLDAVSVGWARMSYDPATGPWLNSTSADGNDWVKPQDAATATDYFLGNGTPYHLNVYADTTKNVTLPDGTKVSALESILDTPERRAQAIAALCDAATGYAGITIDFEGLRTEDYKDAFTAFMTELRAALPADKALNVCVPPNDWYKGFDYRALGEVCSKVIYMVHDYQWPSVPDYALGTAGTDSPVTPFPDVFRALCAITDPETGVQDRSKIALQISFGTAALQVDEAGNLISSTINHPGQETIAKRLLQPDTVVEYDWNYRNPCARYTTEEGNHYVLWYEDARSIADKLDLARMFGITGVSIWRLGNIPSYAGEADIHYDVWSAILAQRE